MRISLDWLKQYIELPDPPDKISDILTSLGLEVEHVEETGSIPGGLKGVVVAEVLECWKHPNADRLHITKVRSGQTSDLQVVCGAPNVAAGQKVLLATQGTTLYPLHGEAFTIKKGKIRGESSEGMLCAEDELGLGADHAGIMVLPQDAVVGTPAADYLQLKADVLFEIGLTPNRADATSHLGVARDLLAWYRVHRDKTKQLMLPIKANLQQAGGTLEMQVELRDSQACPRYSGISMEGIVVAESPEWLKSRIKAMGMNPVNNIVDIGNFIMFELGQPLHVFDYDRIAGQKIIVQTLPEGTRFKTLDELERTMRASDLMICDGNEKPVCLAGIFGGMDSGISQQTTRIFIESAHFKASAVRQSSMYHLLRTQSARCFEKGSDPNMTVYALERAVHLIQTVCPDAKVASPLIDQYPVPVDAYEIELDISHAIQLSGLELSKEQLKEVFFALDMEVQDLQNGVLKLYVPTNKPDVRRAADVVEELCRVYGYDKIPVPENVRISFPKASQTGYVLKSKLSNWLAANGLCEMMNLSLVRSESCLKTGLWTEDQLVYIHNTSNIQLDAMRPALFPGGLESLQFNINRQQHDLKMFETGKVFVREGSEVLEKSMLGIWLYGSIHGMHWKEKDQAQDFFQLKALTDALIQLTNIRTYETSALTEDRLFEYGIQYLVDGRPIIRAGQLRKQITSPFDLKKEVWYGELDVDAVVELLLEKPVTYKEISRFPQVKRDLALVIDQHMQFDQLKSIAQIHSAPYLRDIQLFDIYENPEQLGPGKKSYALSFTFERLDRQFTGEELEDLMQGLIRTYEKEAGAFVRK